MNPDLNSPEMDFALRVVREAAHLAESVRAELIISSMVKTDRSPVTVADFAVQAVIAARLEKAFPNDLLVAEENAVELKKSENGSLLNNVQLYVSRFFSDATSEQILAWIDRGAAEPGGRFWVLDPIDGTKGFLKGEQYAVALALIENGIVKLGVLGCPNLKEARYPEAGGEGTLAFAAKGKGAWIMPLKKEGPLQPLKVSACAKPSDAVMLRSSDEEHMDVGKTKKFLEAHQMTKPPVEMSSLAKHVMLASGAADFFLRLLSPKNPGYREKIWDQAPGFVIIEEAGGLLTDSEGKPLDFTHGRTLAQNRGLLGANKRLHPQILAALKGF